MVCNRVVKIREHSRLVAGSEINLSEDIECFWLSSSTEASTSSAANEAQQLADALDVATSLESKPAR